MSKKIIWKTNLPIYLSRINNIINLIKSLLLADKQANDFMQFESERYNEL